MTPKELKQKLVGTECPGCNSDGFITALVNRGDDDCTWETLECDRCKGTGAITEEQAALVARRFAFHRIRMERHVLLHELGDKFGLSPAQISGWERATMDLGVDIERKLYAWAYQEAPDAT